jgi:hypothetical protein
MVTAKRLAKRRKRENRKAKRTHWRCPGCGQLHLLGYRCPIPKRARPLPPLGSLW